MKCLVIVSCVMALAAAKPGLLGAFPYAAPYVAAAPVGIATSLSSQYHAQDTLGQYSYGYSGGPSAKTETRTADGITRGGYSYIDGNGLVQSANYISDPVNGFRVAATNLPVGPSAPAAPLATIVQAAPAVLAAPAPIAVPALAAGVPLETPEVVAAKAAHFAAHAEARALLGRKKRSAPLAFTSYATAPIAAAPAAFTSYATAPIAAAPAAFTSYATAPIAAAPAAFTSYAAAPIAAAPAAITTFAAAPVSKSFGYSTVTAHADPVVVAAPAHAAAPVAVVEPVKSFGYSTVSAHADPVVVAAPAPAPAVAIARAAPVAVVEPVKSFGYSTVSAHAAPLAVAAPAPALIPAPAPAVALARAAPLAVAAHAPAVIAAPVLSGSSQYQAQDTLGQYSYGYADNNSQKQEVRTADGITQGAYSYVDGHGLIQSVKYHADDLGFRVAATNLPVGPAAP